ncbi:MAG: YdcF family protein [Flavobacteriales bacterium]|nr:YdcF family protein [Flavobacteriales bacterium]MBK9534301.1 YdcF family protein [Flavobacteriales bacterium]
MKYYNKALAKQPFDAVIVPGTPFLNGKWDRITQGRMLWAKHLYDSGVTKNIICSGSDVYSPYKEGEIMRLYAVKMGIPESHVFAETQAEHSTENVFYGYKLARSKGFEKVALASDIFQTKLLKRFVRKMHRRLDAEITVIPMLEDTIAAMDQSTPAIDPSSAYESDFVSIVERESKWKRFMGTLGKHVEWKE